MKPEFNAQAYIKSLRPPFTSKTERKLTNRIINRNLFEGADALDWPAYFDYRDQHKCYPLTVDNLQYAAIYSPCAGTAYAAAMLKASEAAAAKKAATAEAAAAATRNVESLARLATKLRKLEKNDIANVIEKGHLLQLVFEQFEHGDRDGYHDWIAKEIGWSLVTVARYRAVYEFEQKCHGDIFGEQRKIAELNIAKGALYSLAQSRDDKDMVPAIKEVLELATGKALVTLDMVEEIFAKHAGGPIDEPETAPDETAPDEPETGQDEPETAPDDPETDEAPLVPDVPPEPNDLSKALQAIIDHTQYATAWRDAARLINAEAFQEAIEILQAVKAKYHGVADGVKSAADRAVAQQRARVKAKAKQVYSINGEQIPEDVGSTLLAQHAQRTDQKEDA